RRARGPRAAVGAAEPELPHGLGEERHHRRVALAAPGPVAELTGGVEAPTPHGAVSAERAGVGGAGADLRDAIEARHRDRREGARRRRGVDPELAEAVVAEAGERAA